MQKTKSNTKKTFVYQFETHFLIESATDNHEFYFSDKDYLTKSNIFFSKLDKDYVEVIYLNSQPSIVPSPCFEENMKSKYLDTNTVVSKSIVTDTSSDRKIKVVYSISDELTELLVKNNLEYSNNNYFTYLYNFLINKWYFDELYDVVFIKPCKKMGLFFWKFCDGRLIDGFGPDGISSFIKKCSIKANKFQSGFIYQYAFVMLLGFSALLTFLIVR